MNLDKQIKKAVYGITVTDNMGHLPDRTELVKQLISEVLEYVKPKRIDHYPNIEKITVDSGVVVTREGLYYGNKRAIDEMEAKIKELGL